MLVFCEDCGERNIVDPERLEEGRFRYRCSACNFPNTCQPAASSKDINHPAKQPRKSSVTKSPKAKTSWTSTHHRKNSHEEPYAKVFRVLAKEAGILGVYVYHFYDGLIAYDVDQNISEKTMLQIGKAFSVCSPFGHKILKKTKEIYLVQDDQTAVGRNITLNSILVLFCPEYPLGTTAASTFDQAVNSLQVFI